MSRKDKFNSWELGEKLYQERKAARINHDNQQINHDNIAPIIAKSSGRPALALAGETIMRLKILDFVAGAGWLTECKHCGFNEVVKHSQRLLTAAARPCPNCGGVK